MVIDDNTCRKNDGKLRRSESPVNQKTPIKKRKTATKEAKDSNWRSERPTKEAKDEK